MVYRATRGTFREVSCVVRSLVAEQPGLLCARRAFLLVRRMAAIGLSEADG